MSYSNKRKAALEKIHGKQTKANQKRAAPSASGNMPNRASLNAAMLSPQRKLILSFIKAVGRSARRRKALLDALNQFTPEQLRSFIESPAEQTMPVIGGGL